MTSASPAVDSRGEAALGDRSGDRPAMQVAAPWPGSCGWSTVWPNLPVDQDSSSELLARVRRGKRPLPEPIETIIEKPVDDDPNIYPYLDFTWSLV